MNAIQEDLDTWLSSQPPEISCRDHPTSKQRLSLEGTRDKCRGRIPEWWEPVYLPCPGCREDRIRSFLGTSGVPSALMHCTLDNWEAVSNAQKQQLEDVGRFADEVRKGFLVILGPVGVGKSHLAVGVMRSFYKRGGSVWVKQSTLLRRLRATYRDEKADDPIDECRGAAILVLDEMGISGGGKDEAPMLHEILDYRYGRKLPTVVTSNLSWDELRSELGERMSDRMREAAYKVLEFSGPSHRAARRDDYFK